MFPVNVQLLRTCDHRKYGDFIKISTAKIWEISRLEVGNLESIFFGRKRQTAQLCAKTGQTHRRRFGFRWGREKSRSKSHRKLEQSYNTAAATEQLRRTPCDFIPRTSYLSMEYVLSTRTIIGLHAYYRRNYFHISLTGKEMLSAKGQQSIRCFNSGKFLQFLQSRLC